MGQDQDPFDAHIEQWWEGNVDDPVLAAIFGRDERFPHIDTATLSTLISELSLELAPDREADWLAMACRRALALVTPDENAMPYNYAGGVAVRHRLSNLAKLSKDLADALDGLSNDELHVISSSLDDLEWESFNSAIHCLHRLHGFFERTSGSVRIEGQRWRDKAQKELRIRQAHSLSPVFEAAFGRDAAVNERPNSSNLGDWPAFFSRLIFAASGDQLTKDVLRTTVKSARKRHKANPVQHPRSIIPI